MIKAITLALSMCLVSTLSLASQTKQIAESAERVTPLLVGQTVPNVTLQTADGAPVSLRAALLSKPAVIVFYRGGWCPYCSRQLAGLKEVEQKLVDLGFQVMAISPESPKRLQEQKLETEFAVSLYSDESLEAIRQFGIGFYLDAKTQKRYNEMELGLTNAPGTDRAVLPAPAVFIVDQQGLITFNYVNPSYKVRPSAELILQAAKLTM